GPRRPVAIEFDHARSKELDRVGNDLDRAIRRVRFDAGTNHEVGRRERHGWRDADRKRLRRRDERARRHCHHHHHDRENFHSTLHRHHSRPVRAAPHLASRYCNERTAREATRDGSWIAATTLLTGARSHRWRETPAEPAVSTFTQVVFRCAQLAPEGLAAAAFSEAIPAVPAGISLAMAGVEALNVAQRVRA